MKKLINTLSFIEHLGNARAALTYCYERKSCIGCPMFMKRSGMRSICCLPSYLDTGSDAATASRIMLEDSKREFYKAQHRQCLLFDETK